VKKYILSFLLLLGLYSCHVNDSTPDYTRIETQFKLYDTTGAEKYYFKSGEHFEMRFTALNSTGVDLEYQYSGFSSIFQIYHSDSLVCSSVDGINWVEIIKRDTVKNGHYYLGNWIAPYSYGPSLIRSLSPGEYKAKVLHYSLFKDYKLPDTEPINFVVYN
jgi:hypothetical protein